MRLREPHPESGHAHRSAQNHRRSSPCLSGSATAAASGNAAPIRPSSTRCDALRRLDILRYSTQKTKPNQTNNDPITSTCLKFPNRLLPAARSTSFAFIVDGVRLRSMRVNQLPRRSLAVSCSWLQAGGAVRPFPNHPAPASRPATCRLCARRRPPPQLGFWLHVGCSRRPVAARGAVITARHTFDGGCRCRHGCVRGCVVGPRGGGDHFAPRFDDPGLRLGVDDAYILLRLQPPTHTTML